MGADGPRHLPMGGLRQATADVRIAVRKATVVGLPAWGGVATAETWCLRPQRLQAAAGATFRSGKLTTVRATAAEETNPGTLVLLFLRRGPFHAPGISGWGAAPKGLFFPRRTAL